MNSKNPSRFSAIIKSVAANQGADRLLFLLLLALVVAFRILVLTNFSFVYTDSDQSIMWLGLKDYAGGQFHEPRFYGQAYSSMLEALFAVPLYKLGMSPAKALPIVSSVMALLPYVLLSVLVFLKKSPKLALLILSIPLLLPVEYSLISSLPRGFVSGLFVASLGCVSLFYPKSKTGFALGALVAVLAYSINSNSVLISLPVLIYLFLQNFKNKNYYIFSALGALPGLAIHFSVQYFYVLHPACDLHKVELKLSLAKLLDALPHLDTYFNHVAPLFWEAGSSVLLLFLIIAFFLWRRKNYNAAITVALLPFAILSTLLLTKVHDGTDSVFFSYSRMYLALPVMLGISLSFFKTFTKSKFFYLYLLIPIACFVYNTNLLGKSIEKNLDPQRVHVVGVMKVADLYSECKKLKTVCDVNQIQLIIISHHWFYDFFDYGCPACNESFPETIQPAYERRSWRMLQDEKTIYQHILLIDVQRDFSKEFTFIKKIDGYEGYYLIENNQTFTFALLNSLGISYRKFK